MSQSSLFDVDFHISLLYSEAIVDRLVSLSNLNDLEKRSGEHWSGSSVTDKGYEQAAPADLIIGAVGISFITCALIT
jgi:hypothetical protein